MQGEKRQARQTKGPARLDDGARLWLLLRVTCGWVAGVGVSGQWSVEVVCRIDLSESAMGPFALQPPPRRILLHCIQPTQPHAHPPTHAPTGRRRRGGRKDAVAAFAAGVPYPLAPLAHTHQGVFHFKKQFSLLHPMQRAAV